MLTTMRSFLPPPVMVLGEGTVISIKWPQRFHGANLGLLNLMVDMIIMRIDFGPKTVVRLRQVNP